MLVSDEGVEIMDAGHIWGKDTHETEDIIRKETENSGKRVRVSCIGPAGEKLSLIAAIMIELKQNSVVNQCSNIGTVSVTSGKDF